MSGKAISVWLGPDRVFDGVALRDGMALGVADGVIRALSPVAALPVGAVLHRIAGVVTAGFIDLQVNGGGDVLLNATPTAAAMALIAGAHRRFGTVEC